MVLRTLGLVAVSLGAWVANAERVWAGEIVSLDAVADATVFSGSPGTNYGSNNTLVVGFSPNPAGDWWSYIRWNFDTIPEGSTINSVTLRMRRQCSPQTPDPVTTIVQRVSGSWSEGSITWSNKPAPVNTPALIYNVSGCQSGTPLLTFSDSANALRNWVQGIVDGGANNGLVVRFQTAPGFHRYRSRESSGDAPELIVDFTPPPTPDLEVVSVNASDGVHCRGSQFNTTYTIRNNGDGPSGAYTTRFYASTDAAYDGGDTPLHAPADGWSGLSAGQSVTRTRTLVALVTLPPGTYYIVLVLTPSDSEDPPGNNVGHDPQSIVFAVAPPAPASASSDRNNFCADDVGSITLTAAGGGGAGATLRWYRGGCGSGGSIGEGTPLTIDSPAQTTAYFARWESPCGTSSCAGTTVTVSPGPSAPQSAMVDRNDLCDDDEGVIALSASGGSGSTLSWFAGECGGAGIGTGNPLVVPSPEETTAYFARWENSCGSSACASVTVVVSACCPADWTGDGVLDSDDYFEFLEDYFANNADFDDDGDTDSDDFFSFLEAYFMNCP